MRVGITIYCQTCKKQKAPHGRSTPIGSSFCEASTCHAYWKDPKPGCLWPGETHEDFGIDLPICSDGTEEIVEAE